MTFRPIDTAMSPTPDVGASALSGTDLSHSTLSQVSGADFAKANQFFQADGGAASQALTGIDIQGIAAPTPLSGTEALAMMPPTGGVEAGVLGAVPGAEPISPMIQLIMKLPGAMGLISSFFDFLAAFFSPTGLFDMLNPAMWAQHAAVAFSNTAASLPTISMGMLPSNAPILSSLTGIGQPMFSSDLLSAKLNLSLGNSSYSSLAKSGVDAMQGNSLNVGAELTPQSAVYETGAGAVVPGQVPSGHLSGPSLTDVGSANHVANNTRLFSDRLGSGSSFNSMNLAAKTPSPLGNTAASGLGQSTAGSPLAHGMNPIAQAGNLNQPGSFLSNARFEGPPQIAQQLKTNFVPNAGHEVGYSMNPGVGQDVGFNNLAASPNTDASGVTYGPSGYVGNDLASGGNNNLIAMDQPTQSFKPTLSGDGQQFRSAFPTGNQGQMAQGGSNAGSMTGLKAKQLSLDSLDSNTGSTASGAANSKLSAASANKVGDAGAKSVSSDAVKAAKAPAHEVHKVAHEAPKQVAHKAHHTVAKAKPAETVAKQPAEATQQNQAADGNLSQDGIVADGTQIAANDNANAVTQYTVQKGDNLWNIAKEQLGGGAKWQEIYQLNQNLIGQNPDMIYPGTTLQLPGGAPEIASTGTTTMTDYVVKPGDNLWDISEELLGDATKWGDIYKANQDLIGSNPGMIHPGQQLQIPSSDPAGATVASNAVDPTAQSAAVDPNAMGAPSAQPADMGMADAGSVKSMQAAGTEYGAVSPEQYVAPQAQAVPQQVSSYPEAQGYMSAAPQTQFQPTITHQPTIAHQGKGLPVIPANSVPIEAGPGAAWAATPKPVVDVAANTAQAAQAAAASNVAKGQVVAGGVFSNMKSLLGKTQ